MSFTSYQVKRAATILSGAAISGGIDLVGLHLFGVVFPAAMTGTTVALQASFDDGTTWHPVVDSTGAAVSITVTASSLAYLDPVITAALPMIRLVSASTEADARTLQLILRAV